MYETIKRVNGYDINRMKGTRGCYWITVRDNVQVNFKTQKAAAEWAKNN